MSSSALDRAAVPRAELHAALAHLSLHLGAAASAPALELLGGAPGDADAFDVWLSRAASVMGREVIEVDVEYAELDALMARGAPCVLPLGHPACERFLVVARRGEGALVAIDARGERREVPDEVVRRALAAPLSPWVAAVEGMLEELGCGAEPARGRAVERLLRSEATSDMRVGHGWLLRDARGGGLRAQLSRARLLSPAIGFLALRAVVIGLAIAKWSLLASAVDRDAMSAGLLAAWALAFATETVLDVASGSLRYSIAIRAGLWLRRAVLDGALSLDIDGARRQGSGTFLARAIDVDRLEGAALAGGLRAVVGALELLAAVVLLAPHPWLVGWLLLSMAVVVLVGREYTRRIRGWTDARLDVTSELVSAMVGHRTRLVQQRPERWHDREAAGLEVYGGELRRVDALSIASSTIACVFMLGGIALLVLTSAGAGPRSPADDLACVAGLLVGFSALSEVLDSLRSIGTALVAWEKLRPLIRLDGAAADQRLLAADGADGGGAALEIVDVGFRYEGRAASALSGVSLRVAPGDWVLLEGPSGGGKSTLASVMAGLRVPGRGVLLYGGVDRRSLPLSEWRRSIGYCPQFHENFLFSDTLAFNLLMSRRWPPTPRDLELAEDVCHELNLGPLLRAMPLGLQEMVGESGWRLSHGERSRVFIARTLLRGSSIAIFDESFAALDPETVDVVMRCVQRRARTMVTVAHP
ncbi:ATP-binding cassette domain-containing protein [Sorangium sp. So ce1153]|uniref:ATP-binding cassette domain-containing protein n=1 Tax=Sorangium sp. So ce1153 TaxID=3133333 RepID=UPI003F62E444